MSDGNITVPASFIKSLEYKIDKLALVVTQLDIYVHSMQQMSRELKQSCQDVRDTIS